MSKFERIEYDYEVFLQAWLDDSPIEVGDVDRYVEEKDEEFLEFEDYFSEDFIEGFVGWVREGYPDVEMKDLVPRCFEIEGVGPFLISQRFKNGNREMPFVLLMFAFEEEKLFEHLDDIKKLARKEFKKISPLGITTTIRFSEVPVEHKVWNQVVYGKFEGEIANVDGVEFELQPADEPMNYDEYLAVYKEWASDNEELSKIVTPESEDDLEESFESGLYFNFYVDGKFAGIICAEYEYLYGNKGAYIMEELLFSEFRGKGYAKIMQQLFHKALGEDVKYVWGHILAENITSLKTALACGREVLESEVFFASN